MQFERPSYSFRSGGKGFGARLSQTPCHLLACGFGSAAKVIPHSALLVFCPAQNRREVGVE